MGCGLANSMVSRCCVWTHGLPETEENDELDTQDLQERPVLGQVSLQLDVELDQAEHGDRHARGFEDFHPDMSKGGREGLLAVEIVELGDDGDDGEEDADEAVLEDAEPDDVEPGQATPRFAEGTSILAAGAVLQAEDAPEPVDGLEGAEVVLLVVQVGGDVVAEEGEEGADGEGLVAALEDVVVDGVLVEDVAEEADDAVHGDEEQDADDVALLVGFEVVRRLGEDEEEADAGRDQPEDGAEEEAEVVEGEPFPERLLHDVLGGEGAVAGRHGLRLR